MHAGHGPQRLGQEHARPRAHGPPGHDGDRRAASRSDGTELSASPAGSGPGPGCSSPCSSPIEVPGVRLEAVLAEAGADGGGAGARRGRSARRGGRRDRLRSAFFDRAAQRRPLRWRAQAQRDPAARRDPPARSPSSTRSTRDSTSTRCGRWPAGSSGRRPSGVWASSPSPTSDGCWRSSRADRVHVMVGWPHRRGGRAGAGRRARPTGYAPYAPRGLSARAAALSRRDPPTVPGARAAPRAEAGPPRLLVLMGASAP